MRWTAGIIRWPRDITQTFDNAMFAHLRNVRNVCSPLECIIGRLRFRSASKHRNSLSLIVHTWVSGNRHIEAFYNRLVASTASRQESKVTCG